MPGITSYNDPVFNKTNYYENVEIALLNAVLHVIIYKMMTVPDPGLQNLKSHYSASVPHQYGILQNKTFSG